jgi:hypothetical protein
MRLNVASLVWGVLFAVVGVVFIFEAAGTWELTASNIVWIGPLGLVLLGVMLVGTSLRTARR